MSRLDRHVAAVRQRIALQDFLVLAAKALLVAGVAALLYVLVARLVAVRLIGEPYWMLGLVAVALIVAAVWALARRPDLPTAAAAIDERLGLKDKFGTALAFRNTREPFAKLAVKDAEVTADAVSLAGQFRPQVPQMMGYAAATLVAAGLTGWLMSDIGIFGDSDPVNPAVTVQSAEQRERARQNVEQALAAINAAPIDVQQQEAVLQAKGDLTELTRRPIGDAAAANRTAAKAASGLEEALVDQIKNNAKYAQAKRDEAFLRNLPSLDEQESRIADAADALREGDLETAMTEMEQAVDEFDQMTDAEKEAMAQQMQQLANQLAQAAQDPAQQQQMQQQLQQLGMNQQQAQQAAQAMQQAAQGNQQAQQQLQQMAAQAMQQMNNGQGATQQQQQQVQQMLQQMQAQANTQAAGQQMAQAAGQMAQAMQQAQQGAGGNQQQQPGAQPGQQQAGAQQGAQPGLQQMQQTLQQMQAVQQDMQQVQAAQQQAQQVAQNAQQGQQGGQQNGQQGGQQGQQQANAGQQQGQGQQGQGQQQGQQSQGQGGQQGQGQGQGQQQAGNQPGQGGQGGQAGQQGQMAGGQGQGQQGQGGWQPGDPQPGQGGMGGAGQGRGGQAPFAQAPFGIKQELSPSENQEGGQLLASYFVKSDALIGDSTAELRDVAQSAVQNVTDEVDQQRISRQAQSAVRNYFNAMSNRPAPATPEAPSED